MTDNTTYSVADVCYRRSMKQATAAICKSVGFDAVDSDTMELLVHMTTSYILEISNSSKLLAELAGRTMPIASDCVLALVDVGADLNKFQTFRDISATGSIVIPPPKTQPQSTSTSVLRIGKSRPHPSHIPDFLPDFPDPHTYIRTEVSSDPETSYQKVRELSSKQRRDIDSALVDFMLSTHESIPLFRAYDERVRRLAIDQLAEDVDRLAGRKNDDKAQFELCETENSLVRKKIPTYCQIISPTYDSRPYIAALLSDEQLDDDVHQQHSHATTTTTDNSYFRPTTMPPMIVD